MPYICIYTYIRMRVLSNFVEIIYTFGLMQKKLKFMNFFLLCEFSIKFWKTIYKCTIFLSAQF